MGVGDFGDTAGCIGRHRGPVAPGSPLGGGGNDAVSGTDRNAGAFAVLYVQYDGTGIVHPLFREEHSSGQDGIAGQFPFDPAAFAAALSGAAGAGRVIAYRHLSAGALSADHLPEHGPGQESAGTGEPVPLFRGGCVGEQSAGAGQ